MCYVKAQSAIYLFQDSILPFQYCTILESKDTTYQEVISGTSDTNSKGE